jgi:superfamily II DNA/RNA helicase
MKVNQKDENAILQKLGIDALNPMQIKAHEVISQHNEVILLANTGTGKTLAFLLPIMAQMDPAISDIQLLILVPSRELAIQIEQVIREMGSGYKANAVYGGRAGTKDKMDLKHPPSILVGTPGRIVDHINNEIIDISCIKTLVLDEFDKILEVGFVEEVKEIILKLRAVRKKVLTSATQINEIPPFVNLKNPMRIDFTQEVIKELKIKIVVSKNKDKLGALVKLLRTVKSQSGIVFCNFKNSISLVSELLYKQKIGHVCFYGGMEQMDRERALIKFRNGTYRILVATDLAARGIDVPEMDYIIHYELPPIAEEFLHRNGRTARMHAEGTAYVLKWENQTLPPFIHKAEEFEIQTPEVSEPKKWVTLHITGGRKDKISKGDIAGLFFKTGKLNNSDLGVIELKQDCAYVAVPAKLSDELIEKLNNSRLKKKKVRISLLR